MLRCSSTFFLKLSDVHGFIALHKDDQDVLTVVVEDLRLCTVKPCEDIERRFCFEVVSPTKSLGVHCSKVRSLTLDSWEPELLKLMCELGNSTMNQIYEAQCEELGLKKPTAGSSRQDKEAWIKVKYVEKKFLKKLPNGEALTENERKPRRWCVKKCQRNNSTTKAPTARRKYRHEAGNASPAMLSSAATLERKFRRDSLFCPDELDSLFSYFDTGAGSGPRSASHISMQHPLTGGPWSGSGIGPGGSGTPFLLDGEECHVASLEPRFTGSEVVESSVSPGSVFAFYKNQQ
ncbi:arf-gap with coiled- ank repeat and ph domain-containing protein 3 [Limosa lapponica baueri]|uniref:Arf-GAP with coiled-coil, ANK repeat and PH domain-containing protein n=1 Tax=Limosa lapponica baueri TaxID=1758121 RepID=A0A2I0T9Q1_LIMLA|nr:arf-gap with coiled- ank repeat and ph domain-containing protein 3 [Limosa lapponica baueri]